MNHDSIRYARHLALPEVGADGQRHLREAAVLIVGLGGLGSPAAMYLATAGIGRLLLNDFDVVDPTNLQRQLLFRDGDVGRRKVEAAADTIAALNPGVSVVRHDGRLDPDALASILDGVDVVLDCSDNFGTRFLLNRACHAARRPLVTGAAVRLGGQLMSFDLRVPGGPCYACVFAEDDETLEDCAASGILAPLVGVIGAMQAVEAMRVICGIGSQATGRLLRVDAATMAISETTFATDPACRVCGA